MQQNIHKGHRKRELQEFVANINHTDIPHHKLLEMLLYYGVPQKDTNRIAHDLINTFGSFDRVLEADITDILAIKDITHNAAALIKLILPLTAAYIDSKFGEADTLKTREDIGGFLLQKYFTVSNERCSVICLNNAGRLLSFDIIAEGDIESVGISIRLIVERALKTGATAVVLAHNHPSGFAVPSKADVEITATVASALRAVSVRLFDHIIIAGNDYVSMAQTHEYRGIFA